MGFHERKSVGPIDQMMGKIRRSTTLEVHHTVRYV